MDLTAKKTLPGAISIYVENLYQGKLNTNQINLVNSLPWHDWFNVWLASLQSELAAANGYELSLRLTSDRAMETFNSQYRHQDKPTDVLAFAALEVDFPLPAESDEPLYLGDIIISLDTAARCAQAQHHNLQVELAWLASHGLLHLLGWDHPDESSLAAMLDQQANLLRLVGIK